MENIKEFQLNDALAFVLRIQAKAFEAYVDNNIQNKILLKDVLPKDTEMTATVPIYLSMAFLAQILREISVMDDVRLKKIKIDWQEIIDTFDRTYKIGDEKNGKV